MAPITFSYDAQNRCRLARFVGVITDRELLEAFVALLRDPGYDATLNDLVDLSAVTHMGVTREGIQRLLALYDERAAEARYTRNAIIAPTDVLYGVSRMFQTLRGEGLPSEVEVFRTREDAERWMAGPSDSHA